jgi:hypothetical protein
MEKLSVCPLFLIHLYIYVEVTSTGVTCYWLLLMEQPTQFSQVHTECNVCFYI